MDQCTEFSIFLFLRPAEHRRLKVAQVLQSIVVFPQHHNQFPIICLQNIIPFSLITPLTSIFCFFIVSGLCADGQHEQFLTLY